MLLPHNASCRQNFRQGFIDTLLVLKGGGRFVDPSLPAGYSVSRSHGGAWNWFADSGDASRKPCSGREETRLVAFMVASEVARRRHDLVRDENRIGLPLLDGQSYRHMMLYSGALFSAWQDVFSRMVPLLGRESSSSSTPQRWFSLGEDVAQLVCGGSAPSGSLSEGLSLRTTRVAAEELCQAAVADYRHPPGWCRLTHNNASGWGWVKPRPPFGNIVQDHFDSLCAASMMAWRHEKKIPSAVDGEIFRLSSCDSSHINIDSIFRQREKEFLDEHS